MIHTIAKHVVESYRKQDDSEDTEETDVMAEQYFICNLENPLDYPDPHIFLSRENAIARARVIEGKTMGIYRKTWHGIDLQAITHKGDVYLLADMDTE